MHHTTAVQRVRQNSKRIEDTPLWNNEVVVNKIKYPSLQIVRS